MVKAFTQEDFIETKIYIGQGQFGIVFKTETNNDKQIVVLKECYLHRNKDVFLNEMAILHHLDHPGIPRLFGFMKKPLSIVMEWKPGYNLADFISNSTPYRDGVETIRTIAIGIANILFYLHNQKILYRDLKPDNILFDPGTNQIYLIDFGLAISLRDEPLIKGGIVGTKGFLAPEILKKKMYSYPADVYSFGRTIYCLFIFPFYERNKRIPSLEKVDPFFVSMINNCCKKNPSLRPTMGQILQSLLDFEEFKDDRGCFSCFKNRCYLI